MFPSAILSNAEIPVLSSRLVASPSVRHLCHPLCHWNRMRQDSGVLSLHNNYYHRNEDWIWNPKPVTMGRNPWRLQRSSVNRLNSSSPGQNGHHFTEDIFNGIFMNEHVWISHTIWLKFVLKGPTHNNTALVRIMAGRRSGESHYLNQYCPDSLTHIDGTRGDELNQVSIRGVIDGVNVNSFYIDRTHVCVNKMGQYRFRHQFVVKSDTNRKLDNADLSLIRLWTNTYKWQLWSVIGHYFPWWRHEIWTISHHLPFVRGIHRSPMDSLHKKQWCVAYMATLMSAWNKLLDNQLSCRWFETQWRQCNYYIDVTLMGVMVSQTTDRSNVCSTA